MTCTKCGQPRHAAAFLKKKPDRRGTHSKQCDVCREISADVSRRYRERHGLACAERAAEKLREYRRRHPERMRAYEARRGSTSLEKRRLKKNAKNRARNADRLAENQQYRAANRERVRDLGREQSARYRREHPGWAAQKQHRRRSLALGAPGEFTVAEFVALCGLYGNRCLCCGTTDRRLTADHVVPLTKGGSNGIENIQPLCGSCNSRKHVSIVDYRPEAQAHA